MAVFTFEDEITSTLPPAKLYNAMKDADSLTPKIIDDVKSVEIVEGNGGPGTIKKLTIVEDGETKFILHKVEAIDEANYAYNYSVVGGVALPPTAEKITFETKLVEGPNGGSIGKLSVKFHSKGDAKPEEEDMKKGKAKGEALFKAIEGYVLARTLILY
ncbi:pathogenesis-related protein 2-like [Arachis ipaensis]|uniref:pathogenesis-related protein 2-like n=1 Tax=Arachis ipaensis TaxID=130454 RepID=UPI0007AF7FAA|nr:pathogenesis-related protein 2-like [Arachis ipaensis]